MKNKNKVILSILGILMLVVVTVGVTYAVFTYTKLGTTENTVTAGTLKFLYTENTGVGRGINISEAFPVSDELGKSYTTENYVFDFSVEAENSGNEEIPYEVTLRRKSTSTLAESNVKVYLTDMTDEADTQIVAPTLYSDLIQTTIDVGEEVEKTIYNGTVLGGELTYKKDFRLRMWIDETSNQDDINSKTFAALVNVYSNVKVVTNGPIYYSINEVLNSFDQSNLKDVVMCNSVKNGDTTRYYDCMIHDTINDALASSDKGTIIITNDFTTNSAINIDANKEIVLELNGKTISSDDTLKYNLIKNNGILYIQNENGKGKLESNYAVLSNFGNTYVSGGTYIRENATDNDNGGAVFFSSTGYLKVENVDVKTDNTWGIFTYGDSGATIIDIIDSNIQSNSNGITNSNPNGIINVYGATKVQSNNSAVYGKNAGTINIYGGYYKSMISDYSGAIQNISSGTINIKGAIASCCTADANEYTDGVCIYSNKCGINNISTGVINVDGVKVVSGLSIIRNYYGTLNVKSGNFYTDGSSVTTESLPHYASIAVQEDYGGTINISGGEFTSTVGYGLRVWKNGVINASNAIINTPNESPLVLLTDSNETSATINLCSATINSNNDYDLHIYNNNSATNATLNYSNNVKFKNGTNTPVIYGTGNINSNYTGSCPTE